LTPQPGQQLGAQMAQHLQMAQQAYGGQPPGMAPPGAPAGGDVPPPPPGVGSQAAPVPQNGML
jgi:hypothetical protein